MKNSSISQKTEKYKSSANRSETNKIHDFRSVGSDSTFIGLIPNL